MTDKQQKFADEYIIDCNATRAYKAAYSRIKSEEAARANGSRLLTNANIRAYIDERLAEISSCKTAEAQEVMEYLTSVMRREHVENIVVTLMEETSNYIPDSDGKMRKQTIKRTIPKVVEIPAKLSDSNKAAELLGKRFGLFTEKSNLDEIEDTEEIDGEIYGKNISEEKNNTV